MMRRARLRAPVAALIATGLSVFAAAQTPAFAAAQAMGSHQAVHVATAASSGTATGVTALCSAPKSKTYAACFGIKLDGVASGKGLRTAGTAPRGLAPSDLLSAYNLPTDGGGGATIAIVDAQDAPNAAADLATYRQQFGLPPLSPGQFVKVNQRGERSNYPLPDEGWSAEISLDLDMVTAIAPKANILLVEADNASFDDLGQSVNTAVKLGANYVSNSYGSNYTGGPGESADDLQRAQQYYDHPGVAIVASSGDQAYGVSFPAAAPHVTAVGGTSLVRDSSARGWSESVWYKNGHGPGSGCSIIEPKPSFQTDTGCSHRTVADVSAVADPYTGVAVYDTFGPDYGTGWQQFGGTSASSPIIAATYALAGPVAQGSYPNSTPYAHTDKLNDVTAGSNGTCDTAYLCTAGPGYDGPTGLGTPAGTAAFPNSPSGTVSGTVTDAATGKPVFGAKVSVSGASTATTETDAAGTYQMKLVPGAYSLSVTDYDYTDQGTRSVTVAADTNNTLDVALTQVPLVKVSGTVADASGHGWPLNATISFGNDIPVAPIYTDPATGAYSVKLPANGHYPLHVTANTAGYTPQDTAVTTGTGDTVHNIGLTVQLMPQTGPTAPGYTQHVSGSPTETFDASSTLPAGWTTTAAAALPWGVNTKLINQTQSESHHNYLTIGGDVNTNSYTSIDSSLMTPAFTASATQTPFVSFSTLTWMGTADVDYTTDNGATWTTAWEHQPTQFGSVGPQTVLLPTGGKAATVKVRFHYRSTGITLGTWQVDDVRTGTVSMIPDAGGLVVGHVTDGLTSQPYDGATVSVVGSPEGPGTSAPVAGAAGPIDGSFVVFAPAGHQTLTVSGPGYDTTPAKVQVTAGAINHTDLALHAGRLAVTGGPVNATTSGRDTTTQDLTLANTGDGPLTVNIDQFTGSTTTTPTSAATSAQGAPLRRVPVSRNITSKVPGLPGPAWVKASRPATSNATSTATLPGSGWTRLPDRPGGGFFGLGAWGMVAGSNQGTLYAGLGTDASWLSRSDFYAYDPATQTWQAKADAPDAALLAAGGFINGKFYVNGGLPTEVADGAVAATQVYDPATNSWSTGANNPHPTFGAGSAVLDGKLYIVGGYTVNNDPRDRSVDTWESTVPTVTVYDPKTDTWSTARSYPHRVWGESCGVVAGKLYCAGGDTSAQLSDGVYRSNVHTEVKDAYVYDPATDTWTQVADMPMELVNSAYSTANGQLIVSGGYTDNNTNMVNTAYAYDPAKNWWAALPNSDTANAGTAGALGFYSIGGVQGIGTDALELPGYDQLNKVDLPWLTTSRHSLTIQPGEQATITVQLKPTLAMAAHPGTVTAALGIETDSVHGGSTVPVTLTVNAQTTTNTNTSSNSAPSTTPGTKAPSSRRMPPL